MSRRSKNDKDQRDPNDTTKEPWEQPIYDTNYDTNSSRLEQRQQKKGNTLFLVILVIMLLLIITIPIGFYFWATQDSGRTATSQTTESSLVSTETKESTKASSEAASSAPSESSEPAPAESVPESEPVEETPEETIPSSEETVPSSSEAAEGEEYTQVIAGEGFNQIAARTGVSIDTILQLNGLQIDSTILPGQTLRIK